MIIQTLKDAVGVDIDPAKVRHLTRRGHEAYVADLTQALPFATGEFDSVVCSQVLEHLRPSSTAFNEIRRVLKDGGTAVVGVPDYSTWWSAIEPIWGVFSPYGHEHISRWTLVSLWATMKQHGLQPIAWQRIAGAELIIKAKKV